MAKIRGIKPELWTDENFVELSPFARLLWVGLWNYACDNGHLQDKSKQIKMRVLPTDDVNCAELLREIEGQKLIERAGGWITIPNLSHHQKPHKRWWTTCDKPGCVLPEGASHAPNNRGTTVAPPKGNRCTTADVDCDGDGDGEGDGDGDSEVTALSANAEKPAKKTRATQRPIDFRPTQGHIDLAAELGIDLRAEWQQFCDHHDAKGSTYKDWSAALRTWIRNAQKFGRTSAATQPSNVQRHLQLAADLAAREAGPREIGGAS
jgi:hypothetical protein